MPASISAWLQLLSVKKAFFVLAISAVAMLVALIAVWPLARPHLVGAAASALLQPHRRALDIPMPANAREHRVISSDGLRLHGWFFPCEGQRRGTIIYLHGIGDNRGGVIGVAERFLPLGFDVVGMDSRAQGKSEGEICSYGVFEKEDVKALIDTLPPGPVLLLGGSLGGAIAIQTAAVEPRVSVLVAIETFSDLRLVAEERVPGFFSRSMIEDAFLLAAEKGGYHAADASPVNAAKVVKVPVLLIHGEEDRDTFPDHSLRIHEALGGKKQLILVPDAGHNQSASAGVWLQIEEWVLESLPAL